MIQMGRDGAFFSNKLRLWNQWQIPGLVLTSMLLQIILIITGHRRKYTVKPWISVIVWLAYLSSDMLATLSLSNLSTTVAGCKTYSSPAAGTVIIATVWVPLLLLHLAGPDTITALSLEDNDLWLRHGLYLLYQIGVALYVFIRSWSTTFLTFVTIPMLIVGVIKYGDKTWVLRCSSMKNYKNVILLSGGKLGQIGVVSDLAENLFSEASILFNSLEHLLTGLVLSHSQYRSCHFIIMKKEAWQAFDLVASELSCMYDVLFTKAIISFSKVGILFRCVDSLAAISVLIAFFVADKYAYTKLDIGVTYALLFGAVFMELYTFAMIFSDSKKQFIDNLDENPNSPPNARKDKTRKDKTWSGKMAQLNVLDICLSDKPNKYAWILNSMPINDDMKNFLRLTWTEVNRDMHKLIFREIQEKAKELSQSDFDIGVRKKYMAQRGNDVLLRWVEKEKRQEIVDRLNKIKCDSIEFDHNLLLWHIATEMCYCPSSRMEKTEGIEIEIIHGSCDAINNRDIISKNLSDYMLYLLVVRPEMLPKGITDVRYRDTCAVVTRLSEMTRVTRETLIGEDIKKFMEDKDIRARDKSVLFEGCHLAKELNELPRKWEIISEVWVEMLAYAACHCGWKEHAQRLTTGGEMLTHVALVMAHLGFTDQFRHL